MTVTLPETAPVERPADPAHPDLLKVADVLRDRGWAQDDLARYDDDGGILGYCVYGASLIAELGHLAENLGYDDIRRKGHELAVKLGFRTVQALTLWNDAEGRTADEVIERLERAAYGL